MNIVPAQPKIYHITHVDNLPRIIAAGGLLSDSAILQQGGANVTVGLSDIKQRRLSLPVDCHTGICVGDCVPFYFCPRSIMLYIFHMNNHPSLTYHGGQEPIVHLEADLHAVGNWANTHGSPWSFSTSNAGAFYANFYRNLTDLSQINWAAVANNDFRDYMVKEAKQAEFLLHEFFPWELVEKIGVISTARQTTVNNHLTASHHRPQVVVKRDWYF